MTQHTTITDSNSLAFGDLPVPMHVIEPVSNEYWEAANPLSLLRRIERLEGIVAELKQFIQEREADS